MRAVFVFALVLLALSDPALAARKPNVLFLSIDTLRADHLACYGYDRPTSPSIDLVASNGLRFANAHSTAPWTLPSFATMFTGRYPTRHGAIASGEMRDISSAPPRVLSDEIPTLTELLQQSGYKTAAVTSNPYLRFGLMSDFDSSICKAVRADRIGAFTRDWLARESDEQPWFLWVHFNDPHEPTLAADPQLKEIGAFDTVDPSTRESLERWGSESIGTHLGKIGDSADAQTLLKTKLALYDAEIRRVDTEVGRILEFLQRREQLRHTLVILVSDHGEEFHDHVEQERAWGADPRDLYGVGHGHSLFQEQLHVPWIMMGPGVSPATTIEERISLVDFMPTVLGLVGVNGPAGMDGVNRKGWIDASDRASLPITAESIAYGPDRMCRIDGSLKLITDRFGVVQGLYDLSIDPVERTNLLGVADSTVALTLQSLIEWNDDVLANAPMQTDVGELSDDMREGLKSLGYVE